MDRARFQRGIRRHAALSGLVVEVELVTEDSRLRGYLWDLSATGACVLLTTPGMGQELERRLRQRPMAPGSGDLELRIPGQAGPTGLAAPAELVWVEPRADHCLIGLHFPRTLQPRGTVLQPLLWDGFMG